MTTKKKDPRELVAKSVLLTREQWRLLTRDSISNDRSESYVLRHIVGEFYKLPAERRNPSRRPDLEEEEELTI